MRQQNSRLQLMYLFLALGVAAVLTTGCDEPYEDDIDTVNGQIETEYADDILEHDAMMDEPEPVGSIQSPAWNEPVAHADTDLDEIEPLSQLGEPTDDSRPDKAAIKNSGVNLNEDGVTSEVPAGDEGSVTNDGIKDSADLALQEDSNKANAPNKSRQTTDNDAPVKPTFQSNKGTGSVDEK